MHDPIQLMSLFDCFLWLFVLFPGLGSLEMQLSDEPRLGEWTIKATIKGQVSTQKFTVEEYGNLKSSKCLLNAYFDVECDSIEVSGLLFEYCGNVANTLDHLACNMDSVGLSLPNAVMYREKGRSFTYKCSAPSIFGFMVACTLLNLRRRAISNTVVLYYIELNKINKYIFCANTYIFHHKTKV